MAERAGIARDTWSKTERGLHSPQASTLHKMAGALGMSASELLALEEELSPKVTPPLSESPEFKARVAAANERELYELWEQLHNEKMHAELAFRNNPDDPGLRTEYARAFEREMYVFMRLSARQLERARAKVGATSA